MKLTEISPFKQSEKSVKYILNQSFSDPKSVPALSESVGKSFPVSMSHWFYFFFFFGGSCIFIIILSLS